MYGPCCESEISKAPEYVRSFGGSKISKLSSRISKDLFGASKISKRSGGSRGGARGDRPPPLILVLKNIFW